MRWTLAQSTDQFHYWKLEQEAFSAELKYNKQAQSFRQTAGDKRLFFIEKTGFLQHKFLLRTEYSVVVGEVFPSKNWHSGMAVFENKKYDFVSKENSLLLSSKKHNLSFVIDIGNDKALDQPEFYALLFGTLRVITKRYKTEAELVLPDAFNSLVQPSTL